MFVENISDTSSVLTRYQWETNSTPTILYMFYMFVVKPQYLFPYSLCICPQITFWLCAFQNFVSPPLPTRVIKYITIRKQTVAQIFTKGK